MDEYQVKLQQILIASGWSQETLSDKLSVSFVTVNTWVNGKSQPRDKAKEKIDEVFASILGQNQINPEKLSHIKKLAISKKCSVKKLLENRQILDKITVGFTFHTNATEGSTMTESDVAEVLFDSKVLSNRTAIEQREAINHQIALNFLLDDLYSKGKDFRISKDLILATHLRLMNGIISNAGQFRNHGVRIQGARVSLANFIKIPELINKFATEINEETTDPINLLSRTHATFEQIHPFSDGNGRVGRLLLFVKSLSLNIVPPIIRKERRSAYYKYLELAQTESKYDLLENLLAEEIIETSENIEAISST
ncbi:MAG: Fic family protein [Candidatus Nomurabacteria bacterium]|jgi:Fic family protein|nr:Fic family protein [Candidatus Nomurabacteria bacterium]